MGQGVDAALDNAYDEIRDDLLKDNMSITPNGAMWSREKQGFLPALMEKMYKERKAFKKQMLEAEQEYEKTGDDSFRRSAIKFDMIQKSKKLQLNSAYGALGNPYFRWFDPRYAESITLGGQLSIRWIEREVNAHLNKLCKTEGIDFVVASDTDSIYLKLERVVELAFENENPSTETVIAYLDKVCREVVETHIKKEYDRLGVYVNAFQQKMNMTREVIADKGIWTAKKRYILNVHNNEGVSYAEPQLKIMGSEAVRSSTPAIVREKIKKSLSIILNKEEDDLIAFVADFKQEFKTLHFEQVAFKRSLKGMTKYYNSVSGWRKGCPIHVRGALVHNQLVREHGTENTTAMLQDGDKIRFAYLKLPNTARQNVISCTDGLPKEIKL
jgi:DNA polymerase elongation subunit (family B)